MKVEIELPMIEGYEYTGEFRGPMRGEHYLGDNNKDFPQVILAYGNMGMSDRFILRPLPPPWKPPKWLPENMWLYQYTSASWFLANTEPIPAACKGYCQFDDKPGVIAVSIEDWMGLAAPNDTFTPPPTRKIQVRHEKVS